MQKTIFLWSTNPSKIADYEAFISDYSVCRPQDLYLHIAVEENTYSLLENSQHKALARAKASGLPTLAEDTWLFVNALDGKPWVSVKTWGGELKAPLSEQEFLNFIIQKFQTLEDRSCYFLTMLSLAFPDGTVVSISHKIGGIIDLSKADQEFESGYPMGALFVAEGNTKSRAQLTLTERRHVMLPFVTKINQLLRQYDDKIQETQSKERK